MVSMIVKRVKSLNLCSIKKLLKLQKSLILNSYYEEERTIVND